MSLAAWWIAVTNPCCERRAATGLGDRGFEVWYPTHDVEFKTRHMKKPSTRSYPTIPGYLFVRGNGPSAAATYHEMIGIDGLKAVLCNDGKPFTLSDADIQKLRTHLTALAMAPVEDALRIGADVWIVKGPLFQLGGTVSRGERKGSVEILVSLFGRQSVVEVPMRHLRMVA